MTELDPSAAERALQAAEKIKRYILGDLLHLNPSGYDADGDDIERSEQ